MTPDQMNFVENMTDKQVDKHFSRQREIPPGRDFKWNSYSNDSKATKRRYKNNFDAIFPNSPGVGF